MADPQIRSLRVLAGIRRRRGRTLEKELALQRAELERCQADLAEAHGQRETSIREHLRALDQRSRLLDQSFTPAHVRAADFEIETRVAQKAEADKGVKRCEATQQRQAQAVLVAQAAWRRNVERIERFDARIADLLKQQQLAEDESADEEAEEMAAARIGGLRRKAAQAASHG